MAANSPSKMQSASPVHVPGGSACRAGAGRPGIGEDQDPGSRQSCPVSLPSCCWSVRCKASQGYFGPVGTGSLGALAWSCLRERERERGEAESSLTSMETGETADHPQGWNSFCNESLSDFH